jgi:REP element-mobilizing transposase RayT
MVPTLLGFYAQWMHRTYGPHHLHFITNSCYQRRPLLGTARARDCFLSVFEQTRRRYRFVVVGYVVMPEHVHLLITEPQVRSPSTVMRVLNQLHCEGSVAKTKTRRSAAKTTVP